MRISSSDYNWRMFHEKISIKDSLVLSKKMSFKNMYKYYCKKYNIPYNKKDFSEIEKSYRINNSLIINSFGNIIKSINNYYKYNDKLYHNTYYNSVKEILMTYNIPLVKNKLQNL